MNSINPSEWELPLAIIVFTACTLTIGVAGWWLSASADRLADRTGLGEAVTGALLLGGTTSLSGIVVSVTAALDSRAELAMSNALGGIAAQTAFLAVADITYRRANLEHAAASTANMMQGSLLVTLLAIVLVGAYSPEVTLWDIHPATPILFATYLYGISLVRKSRTDPMWQPELTEATRTDQPDQETEGVNLGGLWLRFGGLALTIGVAGWVLKHAAVSLSEQTGLTQTAIGMVFTAVSTSLPELVTTIAAVRRGALTLAVGGIIGGNAFDTLFVAASDVAYREGSIYHAISGRLVFWIALTILMIGVLLMGLIRREKVGFMRIGFESCVILILYLSAIALLFAGG